jgi:hypothetical protein
MIMIYRQTFKSLLKFLLTPTKFFVSFQRSFFLVYFLALLGDWLQGPYVYKLYAYYGFKASQFYPP